MDLTRRIVRAWDAFRGIERAGGLDASFFRDGIRVLSNDGASVANPYRDHDWTYAAINAKGKAVAAVPLIVRKGIRKEGAPEENGPWQALFDSPNPTMTRAQFYLAIVTWLSIRGESIVIARGKLGHRKPNEVPIDLWAIDPSLFTALNAQGQPVTDAMEEVAAWRGQTARGEVAMFAPHEVIRFRLYDPANPLGGLAPTTPGRMAMDSGYAAEVWNAAFFRNNADPGGWIEIAGSMSAEQVKAMKAGFADEHQGPAKRGKTALFTNGAKYVPNPRAQKDMEFIAGQNLSREAVLAVHGVPKAVLGITDGVTFSNFRDSMRIFYENTICPLLRDLEDGIYSQMLKPFDVYAEFDVAHSSAMANDYGERLDHAGKLEMLGYDINDINERLNLGMPKVTVEPIAPPPIAPPVETPGAATPQDAPQGTMSKSARPAHRASIPERRAVVVDFVARVAIPGESVLRRRLARYLAQLSADQKSRFNAWVKQSGLTDSSILTLSPDDMNAILFQRETWDKAIREAAMPSIENTVKRALKATANETGSIAIPTSDPAIRDLFGKSFASLIETNVTTQKKVSAHLMASMAKGETIQVAQMRIAQFFGGNASRALLIARTETGMAGSAARFEQLKSADITKHEWVTANDLAVRDSHRSADGEVVDVGEPFSNGLTHPHQFGADPSEVCNCRCEALAVV